jgi:hypothetical protein
MILARNPACQPPGPRKEVMLQIKEPKGSGVWRQHLRNLSVAEPDSGLPAYLRRLNAPNKPYVREAFLRLRAFSFARGEPGRRECFIGWGARFENRQPASRRAERQRRCRIFQRAKSPRNLATAFAEHPGRPSRSVFPAARRCDPRACFRTGAVPCAGNQQVIADEPTLVDRASPCASESQRRRGAFKLEG